MTTSSGRSLNIGEHIDSAHRMLNAAREQHFCEHDEDALEFLRAARRSVDEAIQALEAPPEVVELHGVPADGRKSPSSAGR